jgi:rsbT co-antagonist protein RsbR
MCSTGDNTHNNLNSLINIEGYFTLTYKGVKILSKDLSKIDYCQIIEYSLDPIIIHTDLKILLINHAAETFFRTTKEEAMGLSPLDIFQESSKASIEKRIQSAYEIPMPVIEETVYRMDGTTVDVDLYCHPAPIGDKRAIQSTVWDITARKESETKQKALLKQINELSSPLVPFSHGISVLPLVGSIDEDRAKQLLDDIPLKVQKQKVECLIIDFSGTFNLDSMVADTLFKINKVMSLLGVRSVITGLRPELVRLAMDLGLDLSSTHSLATVQDAIEYFHFK